jgi:hypothetical protein
MHTRTAGLRLALIAGFTLLGIGAAWAPGSIALDDVMDQLKDNDKLIGEIKAELAAQKLEAGSVICSGARFGGQWTELGGARAVPYECQVGTRKLNIDGTVHLYDENGAEVDMSDENAPKRTFDYKEADITWKWE